MDTKLIGAIGGIIAIVGVFLPWITASITIAGVTASASASGWDAYSFGAYEGLYILILGIITLLIALFTKGMIKKWGMTIFGLIILVLGAYYTMNASQVAANITTFAGVTVNVGYGLYVVIIGGIIAMISGIMDFMKK